MRGVATQGSYCFGGFELLPAERSLIADGKTLSLSSRAFDILNLLVEQRQRIVARDEIINVVWRGMTVDDNNLAVQISTLRRVLAEHSNGRQFIATVPGQGYRFVVPVDDAASAPVADAASDPVAEHTGVLPAVGAKYAKRAAFALICIALALSIGIWAAARVGKRIGDPPRLSIAVLPFRNLSDDPQQTYLADAISDDLTTDLSHIPGSVVIARESADAYRNKAVPTATIGSALGVRYLLEGSIRREANLLHINAQLIEAESGAHLWANAFDVGRDGLDHARSDIVRRLAAVLDYTLVQVESARSLHDKPDNPDAMDLYLHARSILDRGNDFASFLAAQKLYEQAVALSPDYADALAALGSVLLHKIGNFDDPTEWGDHQRAVEVINRAMKIAPQNVAAIVATGQLAIADRAYGQAQESFNLALSLQPDDLSSHVGLAICALALGHVQEAIDQFQAILLTDPTGPNLASRQHMIGMSYLMLGKPQEALRWLFKAGALIPRTTEPDINLGWHEWREIYVIAALQLSGDKAGAIQHYKTYSANRPHRTVWNLASYDSHALSALPGHKAYSEALQMSGMPVFADESEPERPNVVGQGAGSAHGDFDSPPLSVPGAKVITAADLHAILQTLPAPLILDVGTGSAVIPSAILVWPPGVWGDPDKLLLEAADRGGRDRARRIVILGNGPYGFAGYDATKYLVAQGFQNVLWFRGGEETWVKAGYPADDRRFP